MSSRPHPRRLARWTFRLGLTATILIAALWAVSLRVQFGWISSASSPVAWKFGGARLHLGKIITADAPPDSHRGWSVDDAGGITPRWGWRFETPGGNLFIAIPLWAPFLIALGTTGFAWWRLRRPLNPALCPLCSYPRSGLAPDAPCPECGQR